MKSIAGYLIGFLLINMVCLAAVQAAPVNNDIALTVFDGQLLVREQFTYERKSGDDSPANEREHRMRIPTVLAYGVSQDLSVQVTIPYVYREFKQTIRGGRVTRSTHGLGDLKILTKYEFYEKDGLGKTSNAALLGGIEIPTGDFNDADSFGTFKRDAQAGKGTWNPMIALAYNWETFRHEFDASMMYHINTEGHGYEHGDEFRHNVSYQFRIWPWALEDAEGLPGYLFAGFELNGMWNRKDRDELGTIDASGEYVLYASPTLQYISKRIILETSIQLPVIQKVNGEQTESDFVLRGGFRVQF